MEPVRELLVLLRNTGVTQTIKEYRFCTKTIDFMGHVIRPERPEKYSHNTDAIATLQTPTNLTELWSFIGICNVF